MYDDNYEDMTFPDEYRSTWIEHLGTNGKADTIWKVNLKCYLAEYTDLGQKPGIELAIRRLFEGYGSVEVTSDDDYELTIKLEGVLSPKEAEEKLLFSHLVAQVEIKYDFDGDQDYLNDLHFSSNENGPYITRQAGDLKVGPWPGSQEFAERGRVQEAPPVQFHDQDEDELPERNDLSPGVRSMNHPSMRGFDPEDPEDLGEDPRHRPSLVNYNEEDEDPTPHLAAKVAGYNAIEHYAADHKNFFKDTPVGVIRIISPQQMKAAHDYLHLLFPKKCGHTHQT